MPPRTGRRRHRGSATRESPPESPVPPGDRSPGPRHRWEIHTAGRALPAKRPRAPHRPTSPPKRQAPRDPPPSTRAGHTSVDHPPTGAGPLWWPPHPAAPGIGGGAPPPTPPAGGGGGPPSRAPPPPPRHPPTTRHGAPP